MKYTLLVSFILVHLSFISTISFSAENKPFLADRHQARGTDCQACHGAAQITGNAAVIGKNCQLCHGDYQKAVDRTKAKYPEINPHDQHDGDLSCIVCHKGHQKGVNYSEECHGTFVFEVP